MQKKSFHRGSTGWFSEQHLRLVYEQESFDGFLNTPFSKAALLEQMTRKGTQFSKEQRMTLVSALMDQYDSLEMPTRTHENIEALANENTFTITTGHQLSLFTGPLYFVIKILHVIKMTDLLNEQYPSNRFVPVYWMATEDHDFEEIQSCHLFNRNITWESSQTGPVGLFDLEGLDEVKTQLHELFGNNPDAEIHRVIDQLSGKNYSEAMRKLIMSLFGNRGLVIIDGDDALLKKSFARIFEKELDTQFSHAAVEKTTADLLQSGGKDQVMAREINLFYSEKGLRSRIVPKGAIFHVEGKGDFTKETLLASPQNISPNVILRPVYQEAILPNLAYVGGGGEISYWLQLKGVFDQAGIEYPLIQVRNSVVWLDKSTAGKLEKIEGEVADLFRDEDAWKKEFVKENAGDDLDMSATDAAFLQLSNELHSLILGVDASKEQFVQAEIARMEKQVASIKEKAIKFSKAHFDQAMKSIEFIKSRINPNGGLQERSVNFFQFCNTGEVQPVITQLYNALDPFEGDLIVIIDND